MACCGRGREQAAEPAKVEFESLGATGLTVSGPVIAGDARDVPAISHDPKLRLASA